MHTFNKFFALATSFAVLTSCSTSSDRHSSTNRDSLKTTYNSAGIIYTAASGDQTTLSGTRVNPVKYGLAPKWKVQIHQGEKNKWAVGKLSLVTYELGSAQGFNDFKARVQTLQAENERVASTHKKGKGLFSKGGVLALKEISQLIELIESRQLNERDHADALVHIAELATAFNLEYKYPIPAKIWLAAAPLKILEEFKNKPMTADAPVATNLIATNQTDLSKVDPAPSSFWKDPGNIRSKDMYYGFGRSQMTEFKSPCKYDEPKKSYGVSPGIEVVCDGKKYKFKFGEEVRSEPFNARLVNLLGYNSLAIDFVKNVMLEYDRKVLTEFNSRKEMTIAITSLLGFNYAKIPIQIYKDPFLEAIKGAILKDGTQIDVKQLRARLLKVQTPQAEAKPENFNQDFEAKIQYLVLKDTNSEAKPEDNEKNLGSWDWNGLDHANRRELRAFSILAAFMNCYDVRDDNTKLRMVTDAAGRKHLKHIISDLGSGLGQAKDILHQFDGEPNLFPWDMIEAVEGRVVDGEKLKTRYKFKGYSVIFDNASFDRAQVEDARWLVRRLAQVTEAQYVDALIASGWSSAETKLLLEKLVSRRDNLIKVFGLQNEFALFRPQGVARNFNYDPRAERVYFVSSKPHITAPIDNKKVVGGLIVAQ